MEDEMPDYVGREFEDILIERNAKIPGLSHKWTIRVAQRDGAHYTLTRDWDDHRINLVIENGVVVAQTVG